MYELAKTHSDASGPVNLPVSSENPTIHSTVYLRIQPFVTTQPLVFSAMYPHHPSKAESQLQFLLCIHDPSHSLQARTVTQPLPRKWLELWDEHDWVEDQLAETLRLGVEIIGQEYVVARMGWAPTPKPDEDEDAYEKVDHQEKPAEV